MNKTRDPFVWIGEQWYRPLRVLRISKTDSEDIKALEFGDGITAVQKALGEGFSTQTVRKGLLQGRVYSNKTHKFALLLAIRKTDKYVLTALSICGEILGSRRREK